MEAILRGKKKINNSKTQQRSVVYKEGERATRPHSLTSYLIRLLRLCPAFGAALLAPVCTRHLCIDLSIAKKKKRKRSKMRSNVVLQQQHMEWNDVVTHSQDIQHLL